MQPIALAELPLALDPFAFGELVHELLARRIDSNVLHPLQNKNSATWSLVPKRGNVEAFRNLSADYLVRPPEFTRSTTLRWTFLLASIFALVASIFAASQLTDYIETIGAPK